VTLPPETVDSLTMPGPAWLPAPTGGVEVTWIPAGRPPNAPQTVEVDVLGSDGVVLSSHHGTVSHAGSGHLGYSIDAAFNSGATMTALIGSDGEAHFDGTLDFAGIAPELARQNIRPFRDLHGSHAVNVRLDSTPVGRFHRAGLLGMGESTIAELADGTNLGYVQSRRVVEIPILVTFAGEDGAGIAAAHGDDDVCGADDLVGPGLGVLAGDVDAAFGHSSDGGGVDLEAGFGAARPRGGPVAGEVLEEAEGHLAAACVVDAEEEYYGLAVVT
jgi:hypothetical protein